MLEDQWILIGGIGDLNKPSDHGGLPTLLRPLIFLPPLFLNLRIASSAALPPRDVPAY
jgi:hypothetical protein